MPDFSRSGTVAMLEGAALEGNIDDLASMIKQGAAKHVSPGCRNVLMNRLIRDPDMDAKNQLSLVKTLLEAGADAGGVHDGTPHIVAAAKQGNVDLALELALRYGADIDAKDDKGNTALMYLAQHSNDDGGQLRISFLNQASPKLKTVNKNGQNALLIAAEKGNAKCMKTLMELGSKLDQKDNEHRGLLIAAARSRNIDAVRVALDAKVKVDQRDNKKETALFHAIENNAADIVNLLIERGTDVNKRNSNGETPLAIACKEGCSDKIIEALLDAGAKPDILDYKGQTPISRAHLDDMDRYQAIFARYNSKGASAAQVARNAGAGKRPEKAVNKELFDAIASNNFQRVIYALQYSDLVINEPNKEGITPLMHACKATCSEEIIGLLLKFGADPEQKNRDGQRAIDFVPEARQHEFAHFFTQRYIDSL